MPRRAAGLPGIDRGVKLRALSAAATPCPSRRWATRLGKERHDEQAVAHQPFAPQLELREALERKIDPFEAVEAFPEMPGGGARAVFGVRGVDPFLPSQTGEPVRIEHPGLSRKDLAQAFRAPARPRSFPSGPGTRRDRQSPARQGDQPRLVGRELEGPAVELHRVGLGQGADQEDLGVAGSPIGFVGEPAEGTITATAVTISRMGQERREWGSGCMTLSPQKSKGPKAARSVAGSPKTCKAFL